LALKSALAAARAVASPPITFARRKEAGCGLAKRRAIVKIA
jgi:hypothetical protein